MTQRCAICDRDVGPFAGEVVQRDSDTLRFDLICNDCYNDDRTTLEEYRDG